MNKLELINDDKKYIANTYSRFSIDVVSGVGATCENLDGKKYIDFSSGIGVNSLGFSSPQWRETIINQIEELAHISNLYYTKPQVELAKALCERTGFSRVFFANSGAEANEGVIKTARKYSSDKYGQDRYEIITLENSFHGRTITTLAATGQDTFHKDFGPFTEGFVYAKANNIADIKSKITKKTCCILIELIQGEGGVIPLDQEYVDEIYSICKERDILLAVDEVQTGIGRTGSLLCCEEYGIMPDLVSLAKGLGGGLPIGAVLFGEKTKGTLGYGDHGTTFGGNPVITAGAKVVLETVTDKFLRDVKEKGEYLKKAISGFDGVVSVTGKGLMLGVELVDGLDNRDIVVKAAEKGLIILTAKKKLRLLPPLNITKEEIDSGLGILSDILNEEVAK